MNRRLRPYFDFPQERAWCLTGKLGDAEPFGRGEHGRKAVQLAVDPNGVGDFAPIGFESAIEIVKLHAGHGAHSPVEELARGGFAPGILAILLPARDEIVSLVQGFQHAGNLVRIVLQVTVHRDDGVAARQREPVRKRLGFAEVAAMLNGDDMRIDRAQTRDLSPGAVGRAVVDEEDFPVDTGRAERAAQALVQLGEIAFLVHDWNDDRDRATRWTDIRHGTRLEREYGLVGHGRFDSARWWKSSTCS